MGRKKNPFSLYKQGKFYYFRIWDEELRKYTGAKSTGETNKSSAAIKAAKMIEDGFVTIKSSPLAVDFIIERIKNSDTSEKYKNEGVRYIEKHCSLSPEFSRLKLSEVKNKHINRLVDFLKQQGLTGRTVNRIIAYIKPALKAAVMRGYLLNDPTALKIEKLAENTKRRGSLTADEIRKILQMHNTDDLREKPYMVLAITTGMRKGELRALQWHDIDMDRLMINIKQSYTDVNGITSPKTEDSEAEITIYEPTKNALEELRESSPYTDPEDFVIYQANRGAPFPSHFSDKAFKNILNAIGIDESERKRRHLVPHSTRHSFVTFIRNFLPDYIVGALSRHSTLQMIDNYGRPTAEHFKTAREVLNAAFATKSTDEGENIH